ncbi:hypothetical protein ABIE29_004278 [Serratia sp. 2723]
MLLAFGGEKIALSGHKDKDPGQLVGIFVFMP